MQTTLSMQDVVNLRKIDGDLFLAEEDGGAAELKREAVSEDDIALHTGGSRIRSTSTKAATAALSTLWSVTGTPSVIRTDNGTTFTSEPFRQFCQLLNVSQRFISPGNSRANGVNEAAVKRWQGQLRKLDVDFEAVDDDDLDTAVSMANILCNIRKVNGSQTSPYYACWGRTPAVLYGARIPRYKIKTANERLKKWHEEVVSLQEATFKDLIEREKKKKKKKTKTSFKVGNFRL